MHGSIWLFILETYRNEKWKWSWKLRRRISMQNSWKDTRSNVDKKTHVLLPFLCYHLQWKISWNRCNEIKTKICFAIVCHKKRLHYSKPIIWLSLAILRFQTYIVILCVRVGNFKVVNKQMLKFCYSSNQNSHHTVIRCIQNEYEILKVHSLEDFMKIHMFIIQCA